ncbi:MAG: chloride channel protein [Oscillospiraceae bacterium]|nr:chloride channel protein [Oscillospiraceae bacterium]
MKRPQQLLQRLGRWGENPLLFVRWLALAAGVGLVVGAASAGFYFTFQFVTQLRQAHPWLLFLLPAGGVAIVLLYRLGGMERDRGTNFVLAAVREDEILRLRTAPLVFVSTMVTHLFGGSSGREGAILQIGGSISSWLGRLLPLDEEDREIMTMCGMAAGFSALFGTPLTAAIFAMEVVSVGMMDYAALVPCILSAAVGLLTAQLFQVPATSFSLSGIPALSPLSLIQVVALGVLLALLAVVFRQAMHTAAQLYRRFFPNPILRAAVGGALVVALTYVVWLWNPGSYDYNGAGAAVLASALTGQARPEAFALKILFTALTLSAGYKGGEIVPVFFTGATFGCTVAPLLGLEPSFGAGVGLVGLFCGVTNCPVASLLLALELFCTSDGLFSGQAFLLFAVAVAVSYTLSGYSGLYQEQKILFEKLPHTLQNREEEKKQ